MVREHISVVQNTLLAEGYHASTLQMALHILHVSDYTAGCHISNFHFSSKLSGNPLDLEGSSLVVFGQSTSGVVAHCTRQDRIVRIMPRT